jgi:hypothetical protein
MRLHGAADLSELPGESCLQRPVVKTKQTPGGCDGTKTTSDCRAEKAKPCSCGKPKTGSDIPRRR